mgnify:CR=1 FL=1
MISFTDYLLSEQQSQCAIYTQKHIDDLERFADHLLNKWGIDIEFSKHFNDRISDDRNSPCIKLSELQQLFKKISKDHGEKIKSQKDNQAVLKDIQSSLNLPFVIDINDKHQLQVTMKTIMRKKDFKTTNSIVEY